LGCRTPLNPQRLLPPKIPQPFRQGNLRGTPGNPMTADEVAAKALDLMALVLGTGRANELIVAVYKLDSFGPVSGLRRLFWA
jgi:hypothetical protein